MRKFSNLFSVIVFTALLFVLGNTTSCYAETIASGVCGTEGSNITWTLEDDGTLTLSGSGEMGDYGTYTETEDGASESISYEEWYHAAIKNKIKISKIVVNQGITNIGAYAFYNLDVTEVILPEGLVYIGDRAFKNCNSLEKIVIPSTVKYLGNRYSESVSSGGNPIKLYYGGTIDEFLDVTNNKFAIGDLYIDSKIVTRIDLPEGTKTINESAFYGMTSLETITIPEGMETIGDYAFSGCEKLPSISLPESVTEIGKYAFSGCEKLPSISLPESVTEIGKCAFGACSNLQSVNIPSKVDVINAETFSGCSKLKNLIVPETIKTVKSKAFYLCGAKLSFQGEVRIEKESLYGAKVEYLKIADGQTTIPSYAFAGYHGYIGGNYFSSYINTIEFPDSIEVIEERAFTDCRFSLSGDFVLPKNLKIIGNYAFAGCSGNCDRIIVPQGVTAIGDNAFGAKCAKAVKLECPAPAEVTSGLEQIKTIYYPCLLWDKTTQYDWNRDADWCAVHNNTKGSIIQEPTCITDGAQEVICSDCGYVGTEAIPKTGKHVPDGIYFVDMPPSCMAEGIEFQHCKVCGVFMEDTVREIPKLPHKFSAWTITKAATEISTGERTHHCIDCWYPETQKTPVLAPTLPGVKIVKPKVARKSATIKWKKLSKKNLKKVKKIEIQYSLDGTFKTGVKTKYATATKTSYKIKGLKKGKKYYVRIRAYTKTGSTTHVSKWSAKKPFKAK